MLNILGLCLYFFFQLFFPSFIVVYLEFSIRLDLHGTFLMILKKSTQWYTLFPFISYITICVLRLRCFFCLGILICFLQICVLLLSYISTMFRISLNNLLIIFSCLLWGFGHFLKFYSSWPLHSSTFPLGLSYGTLFTTFLVLFIGYLIVSCIFPVCLLH